MRLFKRRPRAEDPSTPLALVDPAQMPEPSTPAEYLRRGYLFYARSLFPQAEADFRQAVDLDADMVDAVYALGMALKAARRNEESVAAFKQVIQMLNAGAVGDRSRSDMLRRLALGHVNRITLGDWNLEKEIWQRAE